MSKAPTKAPTFALDSKVQYIKGVGPRMAASFAKSDVYTLQDLLFFFPRKYEDRSKMSLVKDLVEGSSASLQLTVQQVFQRPLRGRFQKLLEVKTLDSEKQWMSLKWFRTFKGFEEKFEPGKKIIATGTVKAFGAIREMIHPDIQFDLEDDLHVGRIVPIYSEIDGIPTKTLRKVLDMALFLGLPLLKDDIPVPILKKNNFPPLAKAVNEVHFPAQNPNPTVTENFANFNSPAHQRLIYEEFFKFEYHVLSTKLEHEKEAGHALDVKKLDVSLKAAQKKLPFTLTTGQSTSLSEIFSDLSQPHPMNRLLQGDVGAGKTAVAFLSALALMDQGFQVALMAPTEILAEQHFNNLKKTFGELIPTKLLLGKSKTSERKAVQAELEAGTPLLLIGTHALIEDDVAFKNLGLVIIDEQHRFGVDQRRKLREKSKIQPHMLLMTATPIPRTLALTAYGDLSVSVIRERPPGRTPIKTHLVRTAEFGGMNDFIRNQMKEGRQAYFIFPLVNDSEEEGFEHLSSAVTSAEKLANEIFPDFKVGLLHGQMKGNEKAKVMEDFRQNKIQILVSTTVVEVGVDVPNATVMVIEHPERFGLSQLHQLRGRIGRGQHASTCFLKTGRPPHIPTPERLEVMCETEDGFKIAEADLELRGPGEFLGTKQSGTLPFKIANLVRDQEWLFKARDDVMAMIKDDPTLSKPDHANFKRYLNTTGKQQQAHLKTS